MKERNEKDTGRKEGGCQDPVRKKEMGSQPPRKKERRCGLPGFPRKKDDKKKKGGGEERQVTHQKERQTLTKSIILSMKLKKTTEGNH